MFLARRLSINPGAFLRIRRFGGGRGADSAAGDPGALSARPLSRGLRQQHWGAAV
jgi:hypothetical protein